MSGHNIELSRPAASAQRRRLLPNLCLSIRQPLRGRLQRFVTRTPSAGCLLPAAWCGKVASTTNLLFTGRFVVEPSYLLCLSAPSSTSTISQPSAADSLVAIDPCRPFGPDRMEPIYLHTLLPLQIPLRSTKPSQASCLEAIATCFQRTCAGPKGRCVV